MECGLCDSEYNHEELIPKFIKSCAHTYCQKCLWEQKEKDGIVACPMCPQEKPTA